MFIRTIIVALLKKDSKFSFSLVLHNTYVPLEEELDENHDEHRYIYDEASEEYEGPRVALNAGIIDDGVERVRDEVDNAGDEGKRGENSPHFRAVH